MKNFELLDAILNEGILSEEETEVDDIQDDLDEVKDDVEDLEEKIDDIEDDIEEIEDEDEKEKEDSKLDEVYNEVFEELDEIVEETMRETMKSIVMESGSTPNDVVRGLKVLESTEFSREQIREFVDNNIHPVLFLHGVLSESYNVKSIQLPLPVYDIAAVINNNVKSDGSVNESALDTEISTVFDLYDIKDSGLIESVCAVATDLLEEHGMNGLSPSIEDLSDLVEGWNSCANVSLNESIQELDFKVTNVPISFIVTEISNIMTEAPHNHPAKTMPVLGGTSRGILGRASDKLKVGWANVKKAGRNTKKSIGNYLSGPNSQKLMQHVKSNKRAYIGAAAIATVLALIYKKRNSSVCSKFQGKKRWECKAKAVQSAINFAEKQKTACEDSRNPERCKKVVDKFINTWTVRKNKYMKKAS